MIFSAVPTFWDSPNALPLQLRMIAADALSYPRLYAGLYLSNTH